MNIKSDYVEDDDIFYKKKPFDLKFLICLGIAGIIGIGLIIINLPKKKEQ